MFSKDRIANTEVFNDISGELINLYRCVKYHPEALQKELEFVFVSREQFFDMKNCNGMTDIQRAARFYILIKESYGNNLRNFGLKNIDIMTAVEFLQTASKRLSRVVIENQDFAKIIKTYDRKTTLFYLDPPYYEAEKYYPDRFCPEDHIRLKQHLQEIKGMFVLSYNDCEPIRTLYEGYKIIEISRQHNMVAKIGSCQYKELIIKNFN